MQIQINDRVAFSAKFLKSSGERPTSPRWGDRGVVESIDCDILANILWAHGGRSTVNIGNLRCVDKGAGLLEETPMATGNAWEGMGFQKAY